MVASPNEVPAQAQAAAEGSPDAWRRAFERAQDDGVAGWFQAPGDRHGVAAPASASPRVAPATSPSQVSSDPSSQAATARRATLAEQAPSEGTDANPAGAAAADAGRPMPVSVPTSAPPDGPGLASVLSQGLQRAVAMVGSMADVELSQVASQAPWNADAEERAMPAGSAGRALPSAAKAGVDGEDADEVMDAASAAAHAEPAAEERDPLRIHAQWSEDGVRVWLGSDVQGLASVDAVTLQLQQWLGARGTRLLGVVCNGREVWNGETFQSGGGAVPTASARVACMPSYFSSLYSNEAS